MILIPRHITMLRSTLGWPEQRNMVDAVSALVLNHQGRDRDRDVGRVTQ
jgi:hypothetical protein